MAVLYLVSTPIGNLGDLTLRAREVLSRVDRVLAEDTRRTRGLLSHLEIHTPLTSLHAHNEAARAEKVLHWLDSGEELALVSDAGTPLVSDPGSRIVAEVIKAGHQVVPIPGPSAVMAALVGSGLPFDRFLFLGFLPRKGKERRTLLERIASSPEVVVLFESPERLKALLRDLAAVCGPDRWASVARELTKIHEEFLRGTLAELRAWFESHAPRGEITVVVSGEKETEPETRWEREAEALTLGKKLLAEGLSASRAAREVSKHLGLSRNRAYELILAIQQGRLDGDSADPSGPPPEVGGEG